MHPRFLRIVSRFVFAAVLVSITACTFRTRTPAAADNTTPTAVSQVDTPAATPEIKLSPTVSAPAVTATVAVTVTPTLAPVTVAAVNGNLYIRRGSGSDFNPMGALLQGQTVNALGRDILDKWLYVPIPSEPGKFGWISMATIYSSISGDTLSLPVVDSDLAVPAFIQNCTMHNILIQPSGVILPPAVQFPDNIVRFDPGEYTAYDYDSPKNSEVAVIDLTEGKTYRLTAMGTIIQHKCPDGQ